MDTITPVIAMGSLAVVFTNFLRALSGKDWSSAATILTNWVAGVAAVMLAAQSNFADAIPTIGGLALSDANFASQLLFGLSVASAGGVVIGLTKALDNTDSAKLPRLLGGSKPPSADQPVQPV